MPIHMESAHHIWRKALCDLGSGIRRHFRRVSFIRDHLICLRRGIAGSFDGSSHCLAQPALSSCGTDRTTDYLQGGGGGSYLVWRLYMV